MEFLATKLPKKRAINVAMQTKSDNVFEIENQN
jgi:hypothetical protein